MKIISVIIGLVFLSNTVFAGDIIFMEPTRNYTTIYSTDYQFQDHAETELRSLKQDLEDIKAQQDWFITFASILLFFNIIF